MPLYPLPNSFSTREQTLSSAHTLEDGKNERLNPVVPHLMMVLDDCMGVEVEAAAAKLTKGEVMLLENTRFYAGETKNDEKLAAGLGNLQITLSWMHLVRLIGHIHPRRELPSI